MKYVQYALLLLFYISSCKFNDSENTLFHKIKALEYNRVSESAPWRDLQNDYSNMNLKNTFVNSIGKTRLNSLIPLLEETIHKTKNDSLIYESIYALGQMSSKKAENILLNLSFNQLSPKNRKAVIDALSSFQTNEVIQFYEQQLSQEILHPALLTSSAICARNGSNVHDIKKILADSAALSKPTENLAYFLYYSGNINDLPDIVKISENSNDLIKKYALKKINAFADETTDRYRNILLSDSILSKSWKKVLLNTLRSTRIPWNIKLYAILPAAVIKDTLLTDQIHKLTLSGNNHLALTALKYLPVADRELAISSLLSRFGSEKNMYIRGSIIKILAEYFPNRAYSFVMQNLDKGDSNFKSQLLDALAAIKSRMALRTLKQFVYVDDSILMHSAFDNLKELGLLNNKDISHMLNSEYPCCVTLGLNYLLEKKNKVESGQLINIYKKFNHPSQYEIQFAIIDLASKNLTEPGTVPIDSLKKYASHYVVEKMISSNFSNAYSMQQEDNPLRFTHNRHLVPDSIIYFPNNPIVEIETNRGKIKIELFSKIAPYTVNNFLRLIDNDFYSGLTFHRVIPDFVIQCGDPTGTGYGGADYLIPSEHSKLPFKKGSVGMATSGFDTGSSQFFICHSEQPHLNGNYTLFGQVIEGMDTVESILQTDKILNIILL